MLSQALDKFRDVILPLPFLFMGALILLPSPGTAQWRVVPSIGVGLQYDDNPSLNTSAIPVSSVHGYLIEADASIIYDSPLTDFSITPTVRLSRYDETSDLDSDDYFLDFDYDYTGQRSRFRFRGTYGDESARTAERSGVDFDVEEPGDIPDDDSGRVLTTEKRQRVQLSPQWSYQTGQQSLVRIGASYIDVTYEDRPLQFNTDYEETIGTAGFEYNWSERSAVTLDGYYRENYFDSSGRDFSGYGATTGIKRILSEKTRFILNVGIDSTEDAVGEKQTNPIGEISLVRVMETSRVLVSYRRSVSGSGAGEISVRDSVSLNVTRDLSQKFTIGAGLRAYQTSALDKDSVNFDERDYLQLRVLLTWNLTRDFAVELDYAYTNLDREVLASDAESNVVNLWFRYRRNR